jgi:hypothetical protein
MKILKVDCVKGTKKVDRKRYKSADEDKISGIHNFKISLVFLSCQEVFLSFTKKFKKSKYTQTLTNLHKL